jgi:mono/diheme cytochrome c family protein
MKRLIFLLLLLIYDYVLADGQQVFNEVCASCHAQGLAGAPRFGNRVDWAPRIKEGKVDLIAEAYMGVRLMPPKGGKPDLSIEEFSSAVVYMANHAGANWQMPTPHEYEKINKMIKKKSKPNSMS